MEQQRRKFTSPIQVDERFMEQLGVLAAQIAVTIKAAKARQIGLSTVQLDAFLAGAPLPGFQDWKRAPLATEIDDALQPNYTLSMRDNSSVESTDLLEILEALRSRPSGAETLVFTIGRYKLLRVSATFGGYTLKSADADIRGDRPDVQYVDGLLRDLIENAEPSFALLYRPVFSVAVTFLAIFVLFTVYIFTLAYLAVHYQKPIPDWSFALGGFIASPVGALWSKRYDQVFPPVHFSFGRAGRRRSAKRTLLFQSVGVICIPIMLALAQATLS